ncbi:endolysin [Rhizobium phage RHph_Y38]|uniref:Putative endolysin protein n=1 Tax=Rhizobium phage RHph_Y38 TaxID=2509781 RepID=A0A7S5US32_9CAUD|nr:endolysin [Rhizobium phage RHph_Y38]QIG67788.1 putative endolysin protein [Rhizobium phage RHph_Y38]
MQLKPDERVAISNCANVLQVEYATLAAVVQVESNGVLGAWINGRLEPIIRYEGHYFDRLCNPAKRDAARKAGVSSPEAGKIANPKSQEDRWKLVLKAAQIDKDAAFQSCSYGIGQVMGSHWSALGYPSLDDFLRKVRSGFEGQLEVMAKFIIKNGLVDEMRNRDFSGFARGYNGPKYRKYKYDTAMASAYAANGGNNGIASHVDGTLRLGSKGAGVRDLQALLRSAGYNVTVDGDFGQSTKKAIKQFQQDHGINIDGLVGPKTQQALSAYRDNVPAKPGIQSLMGNSTVQKAVAGGIGAPALIKGAKDTVQGYVNDLGQYEFLSPLVQNLNTIMGVLTVAGIAVGIGVAIYKWRESKQTYTGTKEEHFSSLSPMPE